jgi:glycerate kinase
MRVLIAPQELKGTLTAVEAAQAMARGLAAAFPGWELDLLPMADGGPGTTEALATALGGERRLALVHDPLMRPIEVEWAMLPSDRAVIECAAASGLLRLTTQELNPRVATSYGTGELVAAAFGAGARELIVGLGGSASNDGGSGLAQALGFRLLDARGDDLPPGGAALARLHRIDAAQALRGLVELNVTGATDVTNPLCGPTGASAIYGPQKGADAAAIAELDAALAHYAAIIKRDLGVDVLDRPGSGSGGGLGAALVAFLGADLRSGAEVVGNAAGIEARIGAADVVITGEGRLDGQTWFGKAPQYVARLARAAGKPAVCIAGSLGEGYESTQGLFTIIESLSDGRSPLPTPEIAARQVADVVVRAMLQLFTADRDL